MYALSFVKTLELFSYTTATQCQFIFIHSMSYSYAPLILYHICRILPLLHVPSFKKKKKTMNEQTEHKKISSFIIKEKKKQLFQYNYAHSSIDKLYSLYTCSPPYLISFYSYVYLLPSLFSTCLTSTMLPFS